MFLQKRSNEDLYIEAGDHSFPFQIQLPPNLPTSVCYHYGFNLQIYLKFFLQYSLKFEHQFGRVRYSVNSNIDIPWAFDKHTTRSFTVLSHYDLNRDPNARQSYGVSDTKVLCCGPCASDPITGNFSVDKSKYTI